MDDSETTVTVGVEDFNQICRTCLGQENLCSILETSIIDLKVADLLKDCVMIEVKDGILPQNICEKCLNYIYQIYQFKKQCHDIEATLRTFLKNSQSDTNNHEIVDGESKDDISIIVEEVKPNDVINDSEVTSTNRSDYNKPLIIEKTVNLKCCRCDYIGLNRKDLQKHRREAKHPVKKVKNRNHRCPICDKACTKYELGVHMPSHTKEKLYQCKICSERFTRPRNLENHKMLHTGVRPHVCDICGQGFIQHTILSRHKRKYHSDVKIPHQFLEPNLLKAQVEKPQSANENRTRKSSNARQSEIADESRDYANEDRTQKSSNDRQSEMVNESRDYVCDICGCSYKSQHDLKVHKVRHGEKSFLRNYWGKSFKEPGMHYTCTICKKSFYRLLEYKTHKKIHPGEKYHLCSVCGKRFYDLSSMESHVKKHEEEESDENNGVSSDVA